MVVVEEVGGDQSRVLTHLLRRAFISHIGICGQNDLGTTRNLNSLFLTGKAASIINHHPIIIIIIIIEDKETTSDIHHTTIMTVLLF